MSIGDEGRNVKYFLIWAALMRQILPKIILHENVTGVGTTSSVTWRWQNNINIQNVKDSFFKKKCIKTRQNQMIYKSHQHYVRTCSQKLR